jgi:hypothetical protein
MQHVEPAVRLSLILALSQVLLMFTLYTLALRVRQLQQHLLLSKLQGFRAFFRYAIACRHVYTRNAADISHNDAFS